MGTFDLSADLGETEGDLALVGIVTSASIACGGHAGDASSMLSSARAAVAAGVSIGAHASYEDRAGFGRRELGLSPAKAASAVGQQIERLLAAVASAGGHVTYLKLHGALYHRANRDPECAAAILSSSPDLALLAPAVSVIAELWRAAGRTVANEGFCDRAYSRDGTLVPRGQPGAVLSPTEAIAQALSLATRGEATTPDGHVLSIPCDSLCVHGDTGDALLLARTVRQRLEGSGIELRAFAG